MLDVSPDGASALGIGGLSETGGETDSSPCMLLQGDPLVNLRILSVNDNLGRAAGA